MLANKNKILIAFLAILFTAQSCSLLGGGGPKGPPIELVWWKPFDDSSVVQPLIEAFRQANPNINITYVEKNIETYEDEIIQALARGEGPDIYSIHNDWLPKHKDKLTAAPEKTFPLREFRENFLEVASDDLISDDKLYAVPLAVDVLALYYNKDILNSAGIAKPPETWEELVRIAPRLTKTDSSGNFQRSALAMGAADNVNRVPDILQMLMLQNGTPFYSPQTPGVNIDEVVQDESREAYQPGARALEFYTQFANPLKVTYTWNSRSNNSIDAFSAGKAAMMISYSYMRQVLTDKAPLLNYSVAPLPQIESTDTKVNFANYWAEGIAKQSKNADAAWRFLKFISNKETLPNYYLTLKQAAPRIDLIDAQIADEEIGVFAENALSAKSFYEEDSDAVENIFVQMINDVVLRNITAANAINAAAQKISLLIRNF